MRACSRFSFWMERKAQSGAGLIKWRGPFPDALRSSGLATPNTVTHHDTGRSIQKKKNTRKRTLHSLSPKPQSSYIPQSFHYTLTIPSPNPTPPPTLIFHLYSPSSPPPPFPFRPFPPSSTLSLFSAAYSPPPPPPPFPPLSP